MTFILRSPALRMQEERVLHEAKLSKMEAEMKMVFQQKVQEKEAKLKQSEEELYARHREMKDALDKQRSDLEDKKRRLESGRPLTPEKGTVSSLSCQSGSLSSSSSRPRRTVASFVREAHPESLNSLVFLYSNFCIFGYLFCPLLFTFDHGIVLSPPFV